MGSKTTTFSNELLGLLFTNANIANVGDATGLRGSTSPGFWYVDLYSVSPGNAGGGTKVAYTGYTQVTLNRSTGDFTLVSNSVKNVPAISFGKRTDSGAAQSARFWGISRSTTGAADFWGAVGLEKPRVFLVTTASLASNRLVSAAHGFLDDDEIVCLTVEQAGAYPTTPPVQETVYYVRNKTTDDFQIGSMPGGSALTLGGVGSGRVQKILSKSVTLNDTPSVNANEMVIYDD
jgi:hypothetical protein